MNTLSRTEQQEHHQGSGSFRSQLTVIFTIGIFTMIIIGSVSSAWVTTENIKDQLFEDGLRITESLAQQSVLGLLYDSPDNADDAASAALSFPSIDHVSILKSDQHLLLSKGRPETLPDLSKQKIDRTMLVADTTEHWLIAAPVMSQGQIESDDNPLLFQTEAPVELLGYVVVSKSKEKISETLITTITTNLTMSLVVGFMMMVVIHISFNRLVNPLDKLAKIMGRAEEGDTQAYASLEGPREVVDIARAYNKMIEALAQHQSQLRRHNEILEYEVEKRTQDLVYARDMAIQANQNKSNFLSNVSHELRTPLQSILGYSDLIHESLPTDMDDVQSDLNTIIYNANNLLRMINSILDMAKVESGKIDLVNKPTVVPDLIDNVVETIKPLLSANRNEFKTEVNIQTDPILIDGDKLHQILLNLLSNAVKFTQNGTIMMEAIQTPQHLDFRITDTGIGMSEEQTAHIFEPFFQIDGSMTRQYQGTGLGLAITHQFCNLMGGEIFVKSELGQGSSFNVIVPYSN